MSFAYLTLLACCTMTEADVLLGVLLFYYLRSDRQSSDLFFVFFFFEAQLCSYLY